MKHYTLKIKPLAPFLTPLESDTIFGHLCWAMEYMGGVAPGKGLADFLAAISGVSAPLIISNAFPFDYLPIPLLPPLTSGEADELYGLFQVKKNPLNRLEFQHWLKKLIKNSYIAKETFLKYQKEFRILTLYKNVLEGILTEDYFKITPHEKSGDLIGGESSEISKTAAVFHNTINRQTGQVMEGQLFSKNVTFYRGDTILKVYLKTNFFSKGELEALFGFIASNGFGADKSTGYGQFNFEINEEIPFEPIENANACILLSNTHPLVLKESEAYYLTQTKFGKLGGNYSISARYSPLKNPVVLLKPGSALLNPPMKEYYGGMYRDVHPQLPQVQHYGIGYPVQMRLTHED